MPLISLIILPFIGSLLAAVLPANARNTESTLAGIIALACTVQAALLFPEVAHGGVLRARNLRPSGLEVLLQLPAAQMQPCESAGALAISSGLASQSSGPGAVPWSSEG